MALQISIHYQGEEVTYEVTIQEVDVFKLCRKSEQKNRNGEYIPDKILIRKKGKIWISDQDNRQELVQTLTDQIQQFNTTRFNAA